MEEWTVIFVMGEIDAREAFYQGLRSRGPLVGRAPERADAHALVYVLEGFGVLSAHDIDREAWMTLRQRGSRVYVGMGEHSEVAESIVRLADGCVRVSLGWWRRVLKESWFAPRYPSPSSDFKGPRPLKIFGKFSWLSKLK